MVGLNPVLQPHQPQTFLKKVGGTLTPESGREARAIGAHTVDMASIDEVLAKFDAVLRVRFLTRAEGGRKDAVRPPSGFYPCTLYGANDTTGYDARIIFAGWPAELGETYDLPALFLSPEMTLERFPPGEKFQIMDGRRITGNGVFVSHGAAFES